MPLYSIILLIAGQEYVVDDGGFLEEVQAWEVEKQQGLGVRCQMIAKLSGSIVAQPFVGRDET